MAKKKTKKPIKLHKKTATASKKPGTSKKVVVLKSKTKKKSEKDSKMARVKAAKPLQGKSHHKPLPKDKELKASKGKDSKAHAQKHVLKLKKSSVQKGLTKDSEGEKDKSVKDSAKHPSPEAKINKEKSPGELKRSTKSEKEKSLESHKLVSKPEDLVEDDDELVEGEDLKNPQEVILTDAEGRKYCRRRDCDQLAMVDGYCRYHYLLFWKKIQQRKKILSDGKLIHYIEELTSRYPDKFLEMIRRDLRTEKDFLAAIQELEIDESGSEENGDFDEDNSILDEVRGMSEPHVREDDDF